MDNQKAWLKILSKIREEISDTNYRGWFGQTRIESLDHEKLVIGVPSAFFKDQLKSRYLPLIETTLMGVVGLKLQVEFLVDPSMLTKQKKQIEEGDLFEPQLSSNQPTLNPKFTLNNFVVGLSNNVAYAAAQAVAQNPGNSYNPLFIWGGTGVGKTHLMLGIGNAILTKNSHFKVIYCASEKFTNDYVEAIQTRKMGDLRNKYRSADILLVDDVQFFSGRDQTQEEFFHTFNELTAKNSQIVLTSDRPPSEMPKLEDRLKSRFQGGLMVDIQQPGFDTRVAILRAKCQEKGVSLPEDSLNLIASNIEANARELEGKLIQIIQILKIQNLDPSVENIKVLLGQKPQSSISNLNHRQVLTIICNYFNLKLSDLTGPRRNKELVLPRHIAMHILSEDLKMTVEKIGEILGGRDHTTVMHGRDKIKSLINSDREIQRIFIEVKQNLSTN